MNMPSARIQTDVVTRMRWYLGLGVAAILSLCPAPAYATASAVVVTTEYDAVYDGVVVPVTMGQSDDTAMPEFAVAYLPPHLELVQIRPQGSATAAWQPSDCGVGASPPYVDCRVPCPTAICPAAREIIVTTDAGGTAQWIVFAPPAFGGAFTIYNPLDLLVRVHPCTAADRQLEISSWSAMPDPLPVPGGPAANRIGVVAQEPELKAACDNEVAALDAIQLTPLAVTVPRQAAASESIYSVTGTLFGGGTTDIYDALRDSSGVLDSAQIDTALSCAIPGGTLRPCGSPPFSTFMNMRVIDDRPLTIGWTAQNVDPPTPGDAAVSLTLGTTIHQTNITVQQPVTTLTLVADRNALGSGERATVQVDGSLNADNGFEPRAASFTVTPAIAAGWATVVSGTEIQIDVPRSYTDSIDVTVRADADDTVTGAQDSIVLQVTGGGLGTGLLNCRIEPSSGWVPIGGTTELTLIAEEPDGSLTVESLVPTWAVSAGEVVSLAGSAVDVLFTAPLVEGAVTVTAHFDDSRCAPSGNGPHTIEAALVVGRDVELQLKLTPTQVAPGQLTVMQAQLRHSGAASAVPASTPVWDDLRFKLRVGRGVKRFTAVPSADTAVLEQTGAPAAVATLGATVGANLAVTAAGATSSTTASRESWFSISTTAAAGRAGHTLRMPLLARSFAAGQRVSVTLEAYRATTGLVVARVEASLQVRQDPEWSHAAIVGKVYRDDNGDAQQQTGEPGLAGARVVVSSGMVAVTDRYGLFHMERVPNGRHVIKLDDSTLPFGSEPSTPAALTRTLTPGSLTRVAFAFRTPDLATGSVTLTPGGSGLVLHEGRLAYSARFNLGLGRRLNATHSAGQVISAVAQENESHTLTLPFSGEPGQHHYTLTESDASGAVWFYTLSLHAYRRPSGDVLVVPWGPQPVAALKRPTPEQPIAPAPWLMPVHINKGTRITAGTPRQICGDSEEPVLDCAFSMPPPGAQPGPDMALAVIVDPPRDRQGNDPGPMPINLGPVASAAHHFVAGRAGAEVGQSFLSGEPSEFTDAASRPWQAHGEFFYRGVIDAETTMVAGANADLQQILYSNEGTPLGRTAIGAKITGHDSTRVFRDLDPEKSLPAWGDSSKVVDENQAGGRFFFRLQRRDDFLKWGGIHTGLDDTETGRYDRSLYGAAGRWSLRGGGADAEVKGSSEPWKLSAIAFAARPDSVASQDVLQVTGGTLYFLSHGQVVEGSMRVVVEILDEISGLPIRTMSLAEGGDFEADYTGGRMSLNAPIAQRFFGESIVGSDSGGPSARMRVTYEYVPGFKLGSDWSVGGRARASFGSLTLGASAVTDNTARLPPASSASTNASPYRLVATSLRLDLGRAFDVHAELAHSTGQVHGMASSTDGGLSFAGLVADGGDSDLAIEGNAVKLEVRTQLAGVAAKGYARLFQRGYSDSHHRGTIRLMQSGARVDGRVWAGGRVWGQGDHRELRSLGAPLKIRQTLVLGVAQDFALWRLQLGLAHASSRQPSQRGDSPSARTVAALEAGRLIDAGWRLHLRRRQVIAGDEPNTVQELASSDTALVFARSDGIAELGAEIGVSDQRRVFGRVQGGVPVTEDTTLYVGYMRRSHLGLVGPPQSAPTAPAAASSDPANSQGRLVAGGRRRLPGGSTAYAEESLMQASTGKTQARAVGVDALIAGGARVSLRYERGRLSHDATEQASQTAVDRDSGALGIGWQHRLLSLTAGVDMRHDRTEGSTESQSQPVRRDLSVGANLRADYHVTPDFTVALAGRGGGHWFPAGQVAGGDWLPGRSAWEGALGFALRPKRSRGIDVFGRYALTRSRSRCLDGCSGAELSGLAAQPWWLSKTHVMTLAALAPVVGAVEAGPKIAYRETHVDARGVGVSDRALLVLMRLQLPIDQVWGGAIEGRACATPGGQEPLRLGALAEVGALSFGWLRLGAGYNFSSIGAEGVQCSLPGARGAFIRAETVY